MEESPISIGTTPLFRGGAVYSWGNSRHGRLGRDEGGVVFFWGFFLRVGNGLVGKHWNLNT